MDEAALKALYAETEKALLEAQRTDHVYGVREGAAPIAAWPKDPCRIAFLDFDGVLNSDLSVAKLGTRYRFWPASISAMNHFLRETGALIVITSTWREHWTLKENAGALERDGLMAGRVVGKTVSSGKERGLEIDAWLKSVPYAVESFVILDDRDDMVMHLPRLVRVDSRNGLGMAEVKKAIEMMKRIEKHQE